MKSKVYISVGSAPTALQAEAADTIFLALETAGLSPRQMEKNEWSYDQPLRSIRRVIEECDGAVVIAFSRYHFLSGTERKKNGAEEPLIDVHLPTVWNQIEAAMAYTRSLPLLVVAEHGLREDGLLEGRYDWRVFWTDFTPEHLRSEAFRGYLDSWKHAVLDRAKSPPESDKLDSGGLSKMTVPQLLRILSLRQAYAVLSALLTLLVGTAAIAFAAGAGSLPWQ